MSAEQIERKLDEEAQFGQSRTEADTWRHAKPTILQKGCLKLEGKYMISTMRHGQIGRVLELLRQGRSNIPPIPLPSLADQSDSRRGLPARRTHNNATQPRCCEAGNLAVLGCSFAGPAKTRFDESPQRVQPAKFPTNLSLQR
jgi:hypothetical protein